LKNSVSEPLLPALHFRTKVRGDACRLSSPSFFCFVAGQRGVFTVVHVCIFAFSFLCLLT
jgi:hypothetical protein